MKALSQIAQHVFHLSSCTFQNQKIIDESTTSPFASTMLHDFLASAFVFNHQATFYRADHFTGYLTIYAPSTQCTYIFGPFFLVTISDFTNTHYVEKYHVRYPTRQAFIEYLKKLPSYNSNEIHQIACYLSEIINNATPAPGFLKIIDYNLQQEKNGVEVDLLENRIEEFQYQDMLSNQNSERVISAFIRDGAPEQLLEYMQNYNIPVHMGLSPIPLTNYRIAAIQSITLASRSAVEGGLDYSIANHLADIYFLRLDTLTDYDEIMTLMSSAIMNFAVRVRNCKLPTNLSPIIQRIIRYINHNIYSHISVRQLAELFHVNESYLSKLFSCQVKTSLSNYILTRKIDEAKRLLINTDMPLSSISYQLSFSSQAHFQKAFKKISGMTPGEYRKKQ